MSKKFNIVNEHKQTVYGSYTEKLFVAFNGMNNCDILKDWTYRGEGNANVVIAISNTRQILRIKKTDKSRTYFEYCIENLMQYFRTESSDVNLNKRIVMKSITHKLKNILGNILDWCFYLFDIEHKNAIHNNEISLKFYRQVMIPLLGKNYTSEAKTINLSKREITLLEKKMTKLRPEFRKSKRLCYGMATLFADYSYLPKHLEDSFKTTGDTYAIEIKPKQGWISINKQNDKKCQFCKNQYLKLNKKQIQTISNYCPFDLFSGEKQRMLKAISSLIANPQNNFRLFCNGNYAYGELMSQDIFENMLKKIFDSEDSYNKLMIEFAKILIKVLTEPLENEDCEHVCTLIKNSHIKSEYNKDLKNRDCVYDSNLKVGCILEKILSIQQFVQLGLNYYEECYKNIKKCYENELDYVEKFLNEIDDKKCPKCVINKYINSNIDENMQKDKTNNNSVLNVLPYLIASIATDCSLMVTFKRIELNDAQENQKSVVRTSYGNFVANVGVFDLYPKPLSTIPKHVERDLKLKNYSM